MRITAFGIRPRLPPELVDYVIDYLHDDKRTLASCARVCKSWLPASRYHFFERMVLTLKNALRFLQLKPSSISIIAGYVRMLQLDFCRSLRGIDGLGLLDIIGPHLIIFTRVRSLYLHGPLEHIEEEYQENVFKWFSRITALGISQEAFSAPTHVLELISHFKSLMVLHISFSEDVPFVPDDVEHIRTFPFPPTLRCLDITSSGVCPALSWLVSVMTFPKILGFSISITKEGSLPDFQRMLSSFGPSLRWLHIYMVYTQPDNFIDPIDLRNLTNLQALLVGANFQSSTLISEPNSVPKMISRVTSTLVPRVALELYICDSDHMESSEWDRVGTALTDVGKFSTVRISKAVISVEPPMYWMKQTELAYKSIGPD